MIKSCLPKVYTPKPVEEKWAKIWQDEKVFVPEIHKSKKPFVIVIPPPNITGALHMGHALNNILQDVLIRYNRMNGLVAYWAPGTDHGGIATQNVMEKILKTQGITKEGIGREKFLERMWQWYRECGTTILNQLKFLGCSIDTNQDNIRFTMDEQRTRAVMKSFEHLWKKGLIYRGERMINWCPRCGTALSDIEVEYEEEKSKLWYIHYPLEDGSRGITIATTRPETMLGDTAVAVNPEDERYLHLVARKLRLPLVGRLIPIIADERVEKSFGTGALKITPGHDILDFEIGQKHNLNIETVISFEGRMVNCPQEYVGKSVQFARQKVVEDLKIQGYLEKEEHYVHAVGKCYRCNQHIEPLLSEQWFVRMKDLAMPAIKAAEEETIKFFPSSWKKPFIEWLKNIQDWCISRQIWWGHRIPVWYCVDCDREKLPLVRHGSGAVGEGGSLPATLWTLLPGNRNNAQPIISHEKPQKCPRCGLGNMVQDPDVLDTWFSSALWPFSVFNWPQKTRELDYYYPTSVLVTGYEILYLWVARMVMAGLEHMGEVPFSRVYIHGIVRDKHGKKMSKSLGNVIDPLVLMEKYGTDALRFSLIFQAIGGKDIQFAEESIIGGRNFINKIYNVFRFIMMNLGDVTRPFMVASAQRAPGTHYIEIPADLDLSDKWILHRYFQTVKQARFHFENYDLPSALKVLYNFLWDEFCDWYVELSKPRLLTQEKEKVLSVLLNVFTGVISALHPFIPFITEEISSTLKNYISPPGKKNFKFLIQEGFHVPQEKYLNETAEKQMEIIMGITKEIRAIRSQFEVPPSKKINVIIVSQDVPALDIIRRKMEYISILAKTGNLEVVSSASKPKHSITALYKHFTVYVSMEGVVDVEKEKTRIIKEHNKLMLQMAHWEEKLRDSDFVQFAPQSEVDKIKERHREAENKIQRLKSILNEL